jgi:hypothetical protein
MKLARSNVAKKESPRGLIESFMARREIQTIDGKDGFLVKFIKLFPKGELSRDTLFVVRDETKWVKPKTYRQLAEFIGCKPEQLEPRELPRHQRKRKR